MFTCYCGQSFRLPGTLVDHKKATLHGYCHLCKRFFVSDEALKAHCLAFHTSFCSGCQNRFSSISSLKIHQQSTGHCYCKECDRHFVNLEAIGQHQNSSIHANSGNSKHGQGLVDHHALEQHIEKGYGRKKYQYNLLRCGKCGKTFPGANALRQHLASVAHRNVGKITCIASSECTTLFSCPSAMLQHLESGGCPSGISRSVFIKPIELEDIRSIIESCFTEKDIAVATNGGLSLEPKNTTSLMTSLPIRHDTLIETSTMDEDLEVQLATALDERSSLASTPDLSMPRFASSPPSFSSDPATGNPPRSIVPTIDDDEEFKLLSKEFSSLSGFIQHVENSSYRCKDAVLEKAIRFVQKRVIEAGF